MGQLWIDNDSVPDRAGFLVGSWWFKLEHSGTYLELDPNLGADPERDSIDFQKLDALTEKKKFYTFPKNVRSIPNVIWNGIPDLKFISSFLYRTISLALLQCFSSRLTKSQSASLIHIHWYFNKTFLGESSTTKS